MKTAKKKVLIASSLIIITTVSLFVALSYVAQAQLTTLSIQPPTQNIPTNTDSFFDVFVTDINNLDMFDVWVDYDPMLMTPTNVLKGAFVPGADPFMFDLSQVGRIHFWDTLPNGIVASGSGQLARIEFHCVAPGITPLRINQLNTFLWAPGMIPIPYVPQNGQVIQEVRAHTYIDPPTVTYPISTPFTVNINVQDVTNLYEFSIVLTYDTAYVDAVDITVGPFMPPPTLELGKFIDDASGTIRYDVISQAPGGVSGSGTIAVVTFHCTGAGESILTLANVQLFAPGHQPIPTTTAGGRVIQFAYWEPRKLIDIVEWPGKYAYVDLPGYPPPLGRIDGYNEIYTMLTGKGYTFIPIEIVAMSLTGSINNTSFRGTVTSWWSSNTLSDGTRAAILSAEMDDGSSMAMAFRTNLLPTDKILTDPYIIYNAEPYFFIEFYWWAWYPIGRIINWPYWWHDSHNHPNWFWGVYWWWRTWYKGYVYGIPWPWPSPWVLWRPWFGWWWSWVYWRHWYWWSTYFPYDP